MTRFKALLQRAYTGEVFGEALFDVMAKAVDDQGHKSKLVALASLEAHLQDLLRPMLQEHGIEIPDHETSQQRAEQAGALLAQGSWDSFLAEFEPTTTRTLERYELLRNAAPDRDHPALLALIAHEQALREFARAETRGDLEESLTPIMAVLDRFPHHG